LTRFQVLSPGGGLVLTSTAIATRCALPLSAVVSAVRASNLNVGGSVLESNGAWLIVRGVGLIASIDDVKKIVVGASNGVPVYVEQVANVQIGNAFRVASLRHGARPAPMCRIPCPGAGGTYSVSCR